ncbi:MAG: O-antigen ligase family protein [Verrucomicrobia bacterium]|nr:O-antigen ligase family protein [Verrucomicrobiota bacterium]
MSAIIAAIALVIALLLAVVFGPLLEMWAWGPALLALAVACLPAVWSLVRRGGDGTPGWLVWLGMASVGWFGWRAFSSPVADYGMADVLLMLGAVGAFVVVRALDGNPRAGRVLEWGLAILVLASVVLVVVQMKFPGFRIQFGKVDNPLPGGFFGSYSEGAHFLIGCSLVTGALAVFGKGGWVGRSLLGVIALAGMVAVILMRSRGGMVGGAVGLAVFMVLVLVQAKRENCRWFAVGVVAIPLMGIVAAAFLWWGWGFAQESRFGEADYDKLMDNSGRLHVAAVAVSCVARHPWVGGGSRSFSWECYQEWDIKDYGYLGGRPDMVHNELLEAVTGYGIVGGLLLVAFFGAVAVRALVALLVIDGPEILRVGGGWRVGGLAAAAGMLAQSNFSFLFHLMPSMMLLGCCVGFACHQGGSGGTGGRRIFGTVGMGLLGSLVIAAGLPGGVLGTRVCRVVWPVAYGEMAKRYEEGVVRFRAACEIWPQYDLHVWLGKTCQLLAFETSDSERGRDLMKEARGSYDKAYRANPYEPAPVLINASLSSLLGDDERAEREFDLGIRLQGRMEHVFNGYRSAAEHFQRKANRLYESGDIGGAVASMKSAAFAIDKSVELCMNWGGDRPRIVSIHESLGVMLEMAGDSRDAYKAYERASGVPGGFAAHLRASRLLYLEADRLWKSRKPGEALYLFERALERFHRSGYVPVPGISPEQRKALLAEIQRNIATLRAGKVEPKEIKPFAD